MAMATPTARSQDRWRLSSPSFALVFSLACVVARPADSLVVVLPRAVLPRHPTAKGLISDKNQRRRHSRSQSPSLRHGSLFAGSSESDDVLFQGEARAGVEDVDLGGECADVAALESLRRVTQLALEKTEKVAIVAPKSEVGCLVAHAAGARKFVVPSIAAARRLKASLGPDVWCVSRRPPTARETRSTMPTTFLAVADGAPSFEPPRKTLGRVSASRARFLATKGNKARGGEDDDNGSADGARRRGGNNNNSMFPLLVPFPPPGVDDDDDLLDAVRSHPRFAGLFVASPRDARDAVGALRAVVATRDRPPNPPLALGLPFACCDNLAVFDPAEAGFLDVFFVLDLDGPDAPQDDGLRDDDDVDEDSSVVSDEEEDLLEEDDDLEDEEESDLLFDDETESLLAEVERLQALEAAASGGAKTK